MAVKHGSLIRNMLSIFQNRIRRHVCVRACACGRMYVWCGSKCSVIDGRLILYCRSERETECRAKEQIQIEWTIVEWVWPGWARLRGPTAICVYAIFGYVREWNGRCVRVRVRVCIMLQTNRLTTNTLFVIMSHIFRVWAICNDRRQ